MMKLLTRFPTLLLIAAAWARPTWAGDWPQWRGPNLNGFAEATNLPTTWSESENVQWKVELPWWSGSTPIIVGGHIFLTSPEPSSPQTGDPAPKQEGERDPGGPNLLLLHLHRADGSLLWQRELGPGNHLERKHNMASPSPVSDGSSVWVMTGTGVLAAFDFAGRELWRRNIQEEYAVFGQMWGYASSPLLLGDRLIIQVLHGWETDEPSFLLGVDKSTGRTLWKVDRPTDAIKESPDAYTTPAIARVGDQNEIVISGGDYITGHDPESGKELWRFGSINPKKQEWNRTITSPLAVGDVVFAPSRRNPLVALRAGGRGDVTKTHALWEYDKGPDVPTPVSDGKHLWIVDDGGVFSCIHVATGELVYQPQRLPRGTYSPSLVMADGKIYATSESAETTVLEASSVFKILATNKLDDEYTLSTPVLVDDEIFIRTSTHLYCIAAR